MKKILRFIGLAIGLTLSPMAWAGEPATREVAATQPAESMPIYWFEQAAQNCVQFTHRTRNDIPIALPGRNDGVSAVPRNIRPVGEITVTNESLLHEILTQMVQSGEGPRAVALAQEYDPKLLFAIAAEWATLGNAQAALTTTTMIDEKERPAARYRVAMNLIDAGKIDEAQKIIREGNIIRPATLFACMIEKQAESADLKGMLASFESLEKALAPDDDLMTPEIHARLYVQLGAAQANSGDKAAGAACFAKAMQIAGVNDTPLSSTAASIAEAQAFAGDYDAANNTGAKYQCFTAGNLNGLILAASIKRGELTYAQALKTVEMMNVEVPLYRIHRVAIETQIQNREFKAASLNCLKLAKTSEIEIKLLRRILDGFISSGDIPGALAFADECKPPTRALFYAHIGLHSNYAKYSAMAMQILADFQEKPPFSSSPGHLFRRDAIEQLALIEIENSDFEGAAKTAAFFDSIQDRKTMELKIKAIEFARKGKLQEAKTWVTQLETPGDRAKASLTIGLELARLNKDKN